jgi:hypothetical protein
MTAGMTRHEILMFIIISSCSAHQLAARSPDQSDSNLFLFKNGLDYSSKPTAAEISIII